MILQGVRGTASDRSYTPNPSASIREICLLGRLPDAPSWKAGERVEWQGRPYRVAALQRSGSGPDLWRYTHLRPETEGSED